MGKDVLDGPLPGYAFQCHPVCVADTIEQKLKFIALMHEAR
jgi:hypothetical protein